MKIKSNREAKRLDFVDLIILVAQWSGQPYKDVLSQPIPTTMRMWKLRQEEMSSYASAFRK